jgi:MSHA biogenesis protein MshP
MCLNHKVYLSPKYQKGLGLPAAIFVITVLAMIAIALSSLGENNAVSLGVNVNSQRAFFSAESGAQIGLTKVFPPSGTGTSCSSSPTVVYNGTFSANGLVSCSAIVSCVSDTAAGRKFYTFTSTGRCGSGIDGATRVIEVRAKQ